MLSCSGQDSGFVILDGGSAIPLLTADAPVQVPDSGSDVFTPWLVATKALEPGLDLAFSFSRLPEHFRVQTWSQDAGFQDFPFNLTGNENNAGPYLFPAGAMLKAGLQNAREQGFRFRFLVPGQDETTKPVLSLVPESTVLLSLGGSANENDKELQVLLPASLEMRKQGLRFEFLRDFGKGFSSASLLAAYRLKQKVQKPSITISNNNKTRFTFGLRTGGLRDLALPVEVLAHGNGISLDLDSSLDMLRLSIITPRGADGDPGRIPLPADPGLVLVYPQAYWRNKDFEVFRWDANPTVLILDFASTAIQDRFVKRMAFFVEKKGFRGKLQSDMVIRDRHGWNANNYRPDDLAAFYNKASSQDFPLNEEERKFRTLLVEWGLLKVLADGSLGPGPGGLVSVARGMDDGARKLLLNHEALHGLFYASSGLRELSASLWKNLDKETRSFLLRYFDYYQYDVQDDYLMVNEFQAYLLQQGVNALPEFLARIAKRLGKDDAAEISRYQEKADLALKPLTDAAQKLRALVNGEFGLYAGNVGMLTGKQ